MMNLLQHLPKSNHILGIAERVKGRFPSSKGMCEAMAMELTKELKKAGFRADHVVGSFRLDEPRCFDYMCADDEENDEYSVEHDWVNVEGKILDIAVDQFRQYVNEKIPNVVYIGLVDPLSYRYEEK